MSRVKAAKLRKDINMSCEAEMPGRKMTIGEFQMICYRYYIAGQFVQEKQVLEVGCGAGLGLGYLGRRAKRVVGGDYAEDNLRCAQHHYKERVLLVSLDAHELPFKDDCFDVVVAVEVIQYLRLPEFLGECRRVLKSGGTFILCIPNKDRPGFRPSRLSYKYYSAPELFALLNHHFDVELFGAFPASQGQTRLIQQILRLAMVVGVKVLDLFDFILRTRKIKDFVKKLIGYETIVLPEEIKDEDIKIVEDIQFVSLCYDSPDFKHMFLYAIAHTR